LRVGSRYVLFSFYGVVRASVAAGDNKRETAVVPKLV